MDDLIITTSDLESINNIKSNLSKKFKMKDLAQLSNFLRIEFEFNNDSI